MSITDPVVLACSPKYGWTLHQGRETFYDENDELRTWETAWEAREWALENLGVDPLDHLPDGAREASLKSMEEQKKQPRQRRLL